MSEQSEEIKSGPLKTIEERLELLETEVAALPGILDDFANQTTQALKTIQQALGIVIEPNKEGAFNLKILSPSKEKAVGVLAALYWDVLALKKKSEESKIIVASTLPKGVR